MLLNFVGKNIELTESLKNVAEKKFSKLDKYFSEEVEARVVFSTVREEQTVEVTIFLPKTIIRAEETTDDMYSSIDQAVDALARQIRKHKTKLKRKYQNNESIGWDFMAIKNKLDYNYRIGMRAIKTALAVVIGLYISHLLNLNSPIFVSIAAVSSMKPSMSESLKDTKKRLFTCVFGVILGYLTSIISVPPLVEPLIAGLGILITIYILVVFKMRDMTQLSCIVFVASFSSNSDKAYYAVNRIIGTFIGIIVAVLINYLISSPNIWQDFIDASKKCYRSANRALREIIYDKKTDLSEFNTDIASANTLYKLLKQEVKTPFNRDLSISKEKKIMSLIESISVRLEVINNMNANYFSNKISEDIRKRYDFGEDNFSSNLDEIDSVYNYHVEYILKYMDELKELLDEE